MFIDYAEAYLLAAQGRRPGEHEAPGDQHPRTNLALTCIVLGFLGATSAGLIPA